MTRTAIEPSSNTRTDILKKQIIAALSHEEAEEGLYLRNFNGLDAEEDTRPAVNGDEFEILAALNELIEDGRVTCSDEKNHETIFYLKTR